MVHFWIMILRCSRIVFVYAPVTQWIEYCLRKTDYEGSKPFGGYTLAFEYRWSFGYTIDCEDSMY